MSATSASTPPNSPGKGKDKPRDKDKGAKPPTPPQDPSPQPDPAPEPKPDPKKLNWYRFSSTRGPVYGLARRKGEINPRKWGLEFDSACIGHPALEGSFELPPRDKEEYREWKKMVYGQGKGKGKE